MSFVPHTDDDRALMLERVGVGSVDDLFDGLPAGLRLAQPLALAPGRSEMEAARLLASLADANPAAGAICFAGGGVYDHYVPAAVTALLARGEFLTAYTPYQPEVSQGTLQATFEFQTAVCELTGMDVANASMYDGASACAEAVLLSAVATGRPRVLLDAGVDPQVGEVVATYARGHALSIVVTPVVPAAATGPQPGRGQPRARPTGAAAAPAPAAAAAPAPGGTPPAGEDVACLVVQQPDRCGRIVDVGAAAVSAHAAGALLVVVADPLALGVLEAPGRQGADLVVGDGQSLGLPMGFGGPSVGFFAATDALLRRMPGRIAGLARDARGREGFVLTLQAREQHIRRSRATSNICTNQAHCALAALVYLTLLGPEGLREVGELCRAKTGYAMQRLRARLAHPGVPHFKEFVLRAPSGTARRLLDVGYLTGPEVEDGLIVACTERRTREEIDGLVEAVEACLR